MAAQLFKLAESRVPSAADPHALAALEEWRTRTNARKFFLYYESGKSACRVDTDGAAARVGPLVVLLRVGKSSQLVALLAFFNDAGALL